MERGPLLALAAPILRRVSGVDPGDPNAALDALRALDVSAFEAGIRAAHAEGWLTPREGGGVRFGRLVKPLTETHGISIDVVDMSGSAAAPHGHPRGEIDLAFAIEGHPRFDGHAPGWVVYPPGSRHTPTVDGGRMLIVYFLPAGEIAFEARGEDR